ncbi:MAG: hypothetical protein RIQ94_2317 [Pseudomonadota bacterium]|jgi:predicted SAM-dependent methyltransferase
MGLLKISKEIVNKFIAPLGVEIIKSKNKIQDLELYKDKKRPLEPKYINIGAGDFYHPYWHNLDTPNEYYAKRQKGRLQIHYDLTSKSPLPFADGSIAIAYTSHVIEHIKHEDVQYLFDEIYRCLEYGGYFRITCPDIDLEYDAYSNNDFSFWREPNAYGIFNESIEQCFLDHFASSLTITHPFSKITLSDSDLKDIFSIMTKEKALDYIVSQIPNEMLNKYPGDHISWFNKSKILNMLRIAQFTDIYESGFGQSKNTILRNTRYFDNTCPNLSLYIECRKT